MQGISAININSDIFANSITNNTISSSSMTNNEKSGLKFSDVIDKAVNEVNNSQVSANNKIESFIKGEDVTMHEVMLAVQESQMSMQLMLEVRNKIVEAYKEVNSVQL